MGKVWTKRLAVPWDVYVSTPCGRISPCDKMGNVKRHQPFQNRNQSHSGLGSAMTCLVYVVCMFVWCCSVYLTYTLHIRFVVFIVVGFIASKKQSTLHG